jgi:uncharacterized surface protein with fasciclin (FAS1) repeats
MFAVFTLFATVTFGQGVSTNTAYLRILQLTNDNTMISVALQDGRTILANFAPGSVSDSLTFDANHSTILTLAITPPGRQTFFREWAVPPLSVGYHTAAIIGGGGDNSVQLVFIDEDTLCTGKLETGSCVILVNNLKGSPTLRVLANQTPVVDGAAYRQVVVGNVPAATYQDFTAADTNNPQTSIFHLQVRYFEPNMIYIYSVRGTYPGTTPQNYTVGVVRRSPVDTMTFLRGLKADLKLTDTTTLFSAENIVAILEQSGFDQLLQNSALPLTVFAPTDEAILNIAPELYQCVTSNPAAMRALILNHVLVESHTPAQLVNTGSFPTMAGSTHTFRATTGGFLIDNQVSVPDSAWYPTRNGNVYLINEVLVPDGFADQYCVSG